MKDTSGELRRGLWWVGSASAIMRVLNLASTFVLARYLTQTDVGLATLAWSVGVVVEALNGFGLGQAVVRAQGLTHRQLSGIHWFIVLSGFALAGLISALSPVVAWVYHEPVLIPMCLVGASKMVFVALANVRLQLLARDLRFPRQGLVETTATALEVTVKITLAVLGFGAWALVISNAARGLLQLLVVTMVSRFRPEFTLDWADIRGHLAFGARVTFSSALYQLYRNSDFLLVGYYLGEGPLGVYKYAFDLGMSPMEFLLQVVNRVAYPIYSRIQHDGARLREAFLGSVRTLFLLLAPIAAFMAVTAPDLVAVAYGPRWVAAVPLVPLLAWAAVLRGLALLFPQVYMATGHPRFSVYDSLLTGGTLVIGFLLALNLVPPALGTFAVAWAWLLSYPLALAAAFVFLRKTAPISAGDVFSALIRPAQGIACVLLAMFVFRMVVASRGPALVALVSTGLVGLAVYLVYLHRVLGLRLGDLLPRRAAPAGEA